MSAPAPRFDSSDPRRPAEAVRFKYIQSTWASPAEMAAFASMGFAALAMITRFYIWGWLGIFFAISSINGKRNLSSQVSTTTGGMYTGWSCLVFSFTALFSLYFPVLSGLQRIVRDKPFGLNAGTALIPTV